MFSTPSLCYRSVCLVLVILFSTLLVQAQNTPIADPPPARFQSEIERFRDWDAKNSFPDSAVLFVGSSSIRMWKTHLAFPRYPVINRGFGGAHISDVLFYYQDVIGKYRPRLIVLYAGDNDIAAGKAVEQVWKDFLKLEGRVRRDLPQTAVIFISIKPSLSRLTAWEKMNRVNERVRDFCDNHLRRFYLDVATPMLNAAGQPAGELFIEDGLHLNRNGYALWQSLLEALLREVSEKP